MTLKEAVHEHIYKTLIKNNNHRTNTAKELGIPPKSLRNHITRMIEKGYDLKIKTPINIEKQFKDELFPTNEQRLEHLDKMINADRI